MLLISDDMSDRVLWKSGRIVSEPSPELMDAIIAGNASGNFQDYRVEGAPALSLQGANGFVVALGPLGNRYGHPFDSLADLIVLATIESPKGPLGTIYEQRQARPPIHEPTAFNQATYVLPVIGPGRSSLPVQQILNSKLGVSTYEHFGALPPLLSLPGLIGEFDKAYERKSGEVRTLRVIH